VLGRTLALSAAVGLNLFWRVPAAAALEASIVGPETRHIDVEARLEVLEDASGTLSFDDVRSGDASSRFVRAHESPSFGFTNSVYWFRFALQSRLDHAQELLLEIGYPLLDEVQLFVEQPDGTYDERVLGDRLPFSDREIAHRHFVVSIRVYPRLLQHVYLRVKTESSMVVPLSLWTPRAFANSEYKRQIILGLYYGAMLVMLLYNLFVFFTIRDRSYLFYVLYVASAIVLQAAIDGFGYQYLWSGSPWFQSFCVVATMAPVCLTAAIFCRSFLDLRNTLPRWNAALNLVIVGSVLVAVMSVTTPYPIAARTATGLGLVTALLLMTIGITAWRAGQRTARFYVAAWAAFLIGITGFLVSKLGVLPHTFLTEDGQQLGSVLEVMLLSFALGDRINMMRREKAQAQARANENLEREVARQTKELREKNEQLAELDKEKTSFFSNVSHEFRTPLTLTIGPLEALLDGHYGPVADSQREQLEVMLRNSRRLLRLINQLLDLTRLESGRMTASYEPREIGAFVSAVVDAFRPFARSKGLRVSTRIEAPATIYLDPDRMDKVLFNLLSNACKFTSEGEISVVVRRADEAEDRIEIEVSDTGIGIRSEELGRIFERFRQADSSMTRAQEGTGLGLALAKELVELHGGEISATSTPGVGTTMTVVLREGRAHLDAALVRDEATGDDAVNARAALELVELTTSGARSAAPAAQRGGADGSKPARAARSTVLVVDDHPDMREHLSSLLSMHEVRTAADGREALASIEADPPNLVVSDVMMPNVDGYELCAAIKGNPETGHIPVILVTAQAALERKLEGLAARADDYVTKPFQRAELVARVDNLLFAQQQSEALRELNRDLQRQVMQQADELRRRARLGRFLPPGLAQRLIDGELSLQPERRAVTAVKLEIATFDSIAAHLGAESVAALVGQFHTLASEAVFAHDGTIVNLHNCSLEAVFGAPAAMTAQQTAAAAVEAVQGVLAGLEQLAAAWRDVSARFPLSVRGGVDTGEATVGVFGEGEWGLFTVVGAPVVHAGWLANYAVPGEVLATAATVVDSGGAIDLEEPSTVSVQSADLQVYGLPVPEAVAAPPNDELPGEETLSDTGRTSSGPRSNLGSAPEQIENDTVLGGRFRVRSRLGHGGMGAVYEVEDQALGEPVAIKLFDRGAADRERIRREVRLARLVTHENVCRVFDLHFFAEQPAVTMELIRGSSLSVLLREGRLELDRFLRWAIPMCNGLRAAHACGIVHRDLKPSNVLIEDTGRPVLVDFGIARAAAEQPGKKFEGTLDYVAPEQLLSYRSDALSDVYSMGVVMFKMATGTLPFTGESALARAMARGTDDPIDPVEVVPDLHPSLAALILRCLERDPACRFSRVADVANNLERIAFQVGCPWRERIPLDSRDPSVGALDAR